MLSMLAIVLVLLGLGLLSIAAGIVGQRVDDHPICRKCRFDLVGMRDRTEPCPECGASVNTLRAVRIGNRRRRRGAIVLGMVVLLGAVIPAGIIAGNAGGVNWNNYKPQWWLAADARSGDAALFDGAMEEFTIRVRDGRLSRERAIEALELALVVQTDRTARWSEAGGEYLETARLAGVMSPDQLARYLQGAVEFSKQSATTANQGSPWQLQLTIDRRIAATSNLMVEIQRSLLEVNGVPVDDDAVRISAVSMRGRGIAMMLVSRGHPAILSLEPGEHTIRVRARIGIGVDPTDMLHRWDEELAISSTVVGPSEPTGEPELELYTDDSIRERMERAIQLRGLRIEGRGGDQGMSGVGSVLIQQPPVDAAFEIFWRYTCSEAPDTPREVRMGAMTMTAGMFGGNMFGGLLPADFAASPPESVDVVLRPNLAAKDPKLTRIWNGEIIYRDVPLKHPEPEAEVPQK